MLAGGVALLLLVDIIILTSYTLIEGILGQLNSVLVPNKEKQEETIGVRTIVYFILLPLIMDDQFFCFYP